MKDRARHIETLFSILLGMAGISIWFDLPLLLYIGLGVSALGYAFPLAGKYISLGWVQLSKLLGGINSHVILAVIFFVALTPLALLRRLLGSDRLMLRRRGTYWVERGHKYSPGDMDKPW
jgi:hypothetical protein